jgi:hypothetical protein
MTDLGTTLNMDPDPQTMEPVGPAVAPAPAPPVTDFTTPLPSGVHPNDRSSPGARDDSLPGEGQLGPQGWRRQSPWNVDNEDAFPVNQRAASEWSANQYTLGTTPIQLAGTRKGCVSTKIWVPSTASHGCVISPTEGDITQGAGITLSPGDSVELFTEAAVWGGVIVGQTTGTAYVIRLYNPPGGGLGLSSG